jgi:plastocyanin
MPFTWRINIRKNPSRGKPALFEFDQTPEIQVGDSIIWSNNDSVAHFPTPVDQTFVFMANQIAAQSTSPAYAPDQPGSINYVCSLHPGESGTIEVLPTPATT